MSGDSYSYMFRPGANMAQVKEALLLATLAVEGLHGRSRVHLDATFQCDPAARTARVGAGTEVGEAIARIFTALLASTIGEPRFRVERICQAA